MEIRKEFYLLNRGVLSLYNISYLENDFNLVTDKISESLGNITADINKRLLSSFNHLRKIKIKDEKVIRNESLYYPDIYRIYLQQPRASDRQGKRYEPELPSPAPLHHKRALAPRADPAVRRRILRQRA